MTQKKKIILDPYFRKIQEVFNPADLARLETLADIIWAQDEAMPAEELALVKDEAFAIVTGRWRHGSVDDYPNLRAILELGGRHPSPKVLDYQRCFARGIRVLSCAPAFGPMVAEMALGMALAANRDIVAGHMAFQAGQELYLHAGNIGTFTLYDKPVGFVGYGGLARCLKPLLAPFRCKIQVYDPWLPRRYLLDEDVKPLELDKLFETSRVIFVLAIPSAENKGFISRAHLERIQPGSVLVLISRAAVIDFEALTEFVAAGRFKAAVDVFPQEPLPEDHPIRNIAGTVLSAHRAGSVTDELHHIGRIAVNDLEAMLQGLPPTDMQNAQPEIVFRLD